MKITKKLVKVGQSLGLIVDKPVVDKLKLKKGDYVEIEVKKIC
jgi:antitoxin component of MazEF toxin-antitoxin module